MVTLDDISNLLNSLHIVIVARVVQRLGVFLPVAEQDTCVESRGTLHRDLIISFSLGCLVSDQLLLPHSDQESFLHKFVHVNRISDHDGMLARFGKSSPNEGLVVFHLS